MADLDQLKARWAVVQQLLEELEEMTSALGEVAFDDDWKIACIELGIDHTMEPHRAVRQWAARSAVRRDQRDEVLRRLRPDAEREATTLYEHGVRNAISYVIALIEELMTDG